MSDKIIKISIIVPIYNVEDYVKPCIESIIGQSYKNMEIILVDDGSTDRCAEICDGYAKRDERIRLIHKRNGGLVSARKAGIAVATGDYVLGVDGDDWIERNRVEVLVRDGILPTHADMIYLSGHTIDYGEKSVCYNPDVPVKLFENGEIEHEVFPLLSKPDEAFNKVIGGALWLWATRRELLLRNQMLVDDRVIMGEDWLCTCFCLLEAKSVMMLRQGGYHYVQRASSIGFAAVSAPDKDSLPLKVWYQLLKNRLDQKRVPEKIRRICNHAAISFILLSNYDLLLQKFPKYLFPFSNVYSGARIVVYGAGKIGYRLVQSLNKTKTCSIVLWVDENQSRPTVPGHTINPREAIFSADYDFIVVAILNADVAKEVKRSLILDGIPEGRIATMDASVITEDAIPDEIRGLSG